MPEVSVLRLNDTSPVSKMARDASPIACWMVYLSFASCCPRMSRLDTNVRLWAKLKCPVLLLDLTVCVPWFQCNAALKGSLEPALGVSPFN
jgi:hypothetical protein